MSETKWTPGPWRVKFSNFSEVTATNGAVVAKVQKLTGLVQMQDDARLISAAPELYEALDSPVMNRLLGEIEDGTIDPALLWSLAQQWMELRDAALAKARGEQP
ncbi:hypothetical protein [Xanthomonas sp. SHU 199]|uniref:hypothetical protein n=1 Tax=Xanthomonas sp. SHU 199 TaxID=1591174 RepID=UPI00036368DB|nr:hypothetical protein [Xanthomonas sp. SHU 199]